MVSKILKKIGMAIIYYFVGAIFSTLLDTFGFYVARGPFFAIVQVIALGAIICACSRTLRIAKLKKVHKGDESDEKKIFNSDLMTKIKFVVSTKDFIIEAVLFVLVSLIVFVNPAMGGMLLVATSKVTYILSLCIAVILSAIYMSALDITAWIMAYNRCYKRREY